MAETSMSLEELVRKLMGEPIPRFCAWARSGNPQMQ
jgi:hypothetical protein